MFKSMSTLNRKTKFFTFIIFLIFISCGSDSTDDILDGELVNLISIEGNTITDGGTSQLTVVVTPESASNKEVTWSVSKASVASISQTGLLTAVSNGEVRVIARAKDDSGVTAEKDFVISGVTSSDILIESISVSANDITNGASQQLSVTILPLNASNQEITWSVSDSSIAEITNDGLLTPKANGTIIITATATDGSGIYGEIQIMVSGINSNIQGTIVSTPQELLTAIGNATAGDNIYVIDGNYTFNSTINISKNGDASNLISLLSHPDNTERPIFNFSSMSESSSNRGISLSGHFWHVKGIDIVGAGDNGMYLSGNNNLIEFCIFSENKDTGLQIGNGGSNNTILNCDSFYNADSSLENADGFACKLDAGTGNKFIGCRAWQNLDDGWDGYLRGNDNITTTYENCWAFMNGYLKDGSVGAGDGNGFKTGGSDDKQLRHNAVYKNCIAAGNIYDGFDHNSNRGDVEIYNCVSYKNGRNINFSNTNIANSLTIKNTASFSGDSSDSYRGTTLDVTNNGWQNGITTNTDDFISVDITLLSSNRDVDGNLPTIDFMKLNSGSDLIDAGIDVGLSFNGTAPDIGAFEKE